MADHVDIVFDGPPGPEGNRFIEVEDANGKSIAFGEWIERKDGRWVLRITAADLQKPRRAVDIAKVQAALDPGWRSASDGEGPGNGSDVTNSVHPAFIRALRTDLARPPAERRGLALRGQVRRLPHAGPQGGPRRSRSTRATAPTGPSASRISPQR